MLQIASGKLELLSILFDRYHVRIYNFFLKMCHNKMVVYIYSYMKFKKNLFLVFTFLSIISYCQQQNQIKMTTNKFEPKNGEILFFIGQDSEAIGGFSDYKEGYLDFFSIPDGITLYSNLSPGDKSFGYYQKGLDGLAKKANWGAGDSFAQPFVDDDRFKNKAIAIGLSLVNHEKKIAKGKHDGLIKELGAWIISTKRPIFLRIGYEFDGWDWNHYKKKHFLKAWKRIHTIFKKMNVENVAFVWQSKGTGSDQNLLEDWYPGDEYVDWCGYSYFHNPDKEMLTFARKHNKPVFIAEACPVLKNRFDEFHADLKVEDKHVWEKWFVPFFETINNNSDVIKAFSYINVEWKSQVMWSNNSYFKGVDSRIQKSEYVTKKWFQELEKLKKRK